MSLYSHSLVRQRTQGIPGHSERPAFRAEDMSLAIVEARGREHDTGGMTCSFDVLHSDGTVVSYAATA